MRSSMFSGLVLLTALLTTAKKSSSFFPERGNAEADLDFKINIYGDDARSFLEPRTDKSWPEQPYRPQTPDSPILPGNPYEPKSRPKLPDRLGTHKTPIGERSTNPAGFGLQIWMQNEGLKQVEAKRQSAKASNIISNAFRESKKAFIGNMNRRIDWSLSYNDKENAWLKRLEEEQGRKHQIRKALAQGNKANYIIRDSGKGIMNVAKSTKSLWNHMENFASQRPLPIGHPLRDPTQKGLHLFVQNRRNQPKQIDKPRVQKLQEVEKKAWKVFDEEIHRYNRLPFGLTLQQEKNHAVDRAGPNHPARTGSKEAYRRAKSAQERVREAQMMPWAAQQDRESVAKMWDTIPKIRKALRESNQQKSQENRNSPTQAKSPKQAKSPSSSR